MSEDLERRDEYLLPADTAGPHSIFIRRLSQHSMEGLLAGKDGGSARIAFPNSFALSQCSWELPQLTGVTWFEDSPRSAEGSGEVGLFHVPYQDAPEIVRLDYDLTEETVPWLEGVVLVVRHDESAVHMLRFHGAATLNFFGTVTAIWSGFWLIVLVCVVWGARPKAPPASSEE
jgi:hypothetical protein